MLISCLLLILVNILCSVFSLLRQLKNMLENSQVAVGKFTSGLWKVACGNSTSGLWKVAFGKFISGLCKIHKWCLNYKSLWILTSRQIPQVACGKFTSSLWKIHKQLVDNSQVPFGEFTSRFWKVNKQVLVRFYFHCVSILIIRDNSKLLIRLIHLHCFVYVVAWRLT